MTYFMTHDPILPYIKICHKQPFRIFELKKHQEKKI